MTGIITLIAVVLLLVGLIALVGSFFIQKEHIENKGTEFERTVPGANPALAALLSAKSGIVMLVFGLGFFGLSHSIFYAERGTYYEIIYPNGTKAAEFDEGYHIVTPFTKVNAWTANIDVKAGDIAKMSKDVEGKMKSIDVTFVDQVGAKISSAYRFTLPRDEKTFLDLAVNYRSIQNLTENTLIPTIAEQAKLTSKMFSAQDYISGSSQEFRATFEEQLKGGTYIVKRNINRDTTWTSITQNNKDRQIKDISISYAVEKEIDPKTKLPKRIQNEISKSGIIVSQVIVNSVDVDADYKKRLVAQKAESATRQLEQQKIETAKIAQQRFKADGERDKAKEAAIQEIAQVKKLIAIETRLKEEATNLELAKIKLETAKTEAEQKLVAANAEAKSIRLKRQSGGIDPKEELKMRLEAEVQKEQARSKRPVPHTMIVGGSSGKGSVSAETLLQMQLVEKMNK